MVLRCPRDDSELQVGKEHAVEVDRCPTCEGAWYEDQELAELEATVAEDDARRGMIDYAKRESEFKCPVCGEVMRAFNYRAYNLELDACTQEHGFWLDAGESKRVREVMDERVKGLRRHDTAQESWNRAKGRGGGGVLDKLGGLFRRR